MITRRRADLGGRPTTLLYRHGPNLALAATSLILLFLSFARGRDYGMASGEIEPSWRYRIYAAPIVLSQIYHHRPYDYVGYQKLSIPFQAPTPSIEELAPKLQHIEQVDGQGLFFILADDKGVVDFTRIAFLLYGIRTASLYYMYFTVLVASSALFIVSYFGDRRKLALLVFFSLALFATMPAFVARPPGINVLDIHAFGILSIVATLHILLAATDPAPTRPLHFLTTLFQALVIAFIYHARSSTISHAAAVLIAYPVIVYCHCRIHRSSLQRPSMFRRFVPLGILASIIALVPVYQRVMYHPDYFGRRATLGHVVYHNLLMGLQWNPHIRERYDLGEADLGVARAVDAFLERKARHRIAGREQWAVMGMLTVTTQESFDWVEYEEAGRELFTTILRQEPWESWLTYVYYHPVDLFLIVQSYLGAALPPRAGLDTPTRQGLDTRYIYNPIGLQYLFVLVATAALRIGRPRFVDTAYAMVLLTATLVVPLVFYAGDFIILAEVFVAATLAVYVAVAELISFLFELMLRMMTGSRPVYVRS
jgi:hypothetical protein